MSEQVTKDSLTSVQECRLYLILTLATALTFCLLSAAIVIFACIRYAIILPLSLVIMEFIIWIFAADLKQISLPMKSIKSYNFVGCFLR